MDKDHRLFNKLRQHALEHGLKVELVSRKVLLDFGGMNPAIGKDWGFPGDNDTFYILRSDPVETKCETLRHEIEEYVRRKNGEKYWPAHKQCLKNEGKQTMPSMKGIKREKRKPTLGTVR